MAFDTNTQTPKRGRKRYDPWTKELVRSKYPLCSTPADRLILAQESDTVTIEKLYNLASRLGATGSDVHEWAMSEKHPAFARGRRLLRSDDVVRDLNFTREEDLYLTNHFLLGSAGRLAVEQLAYNLHRTDRNGVDLRLCTETAVSYRLRELGLRNVPEFYDAERVADWLFGLATAKNDAGHVLYEDGERLYRTRKAGQSMTLLRALQAAGLELYDCTDRDGVVSITVVSTISLARVLFHNRNWRRWVRDFNSDLFFIEDIRASVAELQTGSSNFEANAWVSHGHTCLNPFTGASFGTFYDGYDEKMAGAELHPSDLTPEAKVSSERWARGENRHACHIITDSFARIAGQASRNDAATGKVKRSSARLIYT